MTAWNRVFQRCLNRRADLSAPALNLGKRRPTFGNHGVQAKHGQRTSRDLARRRIAGRDGEHFLHDADGGLRGFDATLVRAFEHAAHA